MHQNQGIIIFNNFIDSFAFFPYCSIVSIQLRKSFECFATFNLYKFLVMIFLGVFSENSTWRYIDNIMNFFIPVHISSTIKAGSCLCSNAIGMVYGCECCDWFVVLTAYLIVVCSTQVSHRQQSHRRSNPVAPCCCSSDRGFHLVILLHLRDGLLEV